MGILSILEHNEQIKDFYHQLDRGIDNAKSPEELYRLVERVKSFGKPLKYNNTFIFIGIGGLLFLLMILSLMQGWNDYPLLLIFILIAVILLSIFAFKRSRAMPNSSKKIFLKKVLFDNHLTPETFNGVEMALALQQRFKDFIRGNDKREIKQLYSGLYQGSDHQFKYHYYQYHYVVRRVETSRDSDGKISRETVYDDYYRYGVFLDFPYVSGISLDKPGLFNGGVYKPASNEFNRCYVVNGQSEMVAAKFLKPMIVSALTNAYSQYKELHFEFNAASQLCMSFNDNHLLDYTQQFTLEQPDLFLAELKEPKILTGLQAVLVHIEQLMTYSDNNFDTNREKGL
ncbi:hypothetical protein [Zophobihabitans entericus]|uniref:DUF3137 domain-containing protein n=1 Tax=Zophobihabitans entericus TaxID=1635327 RepID=A0A6G9I9J6_9GAMM|nr:hypothetical protein [Zophobihabitans entericus]QIQ20250.1 hypothetical protein IPMB12_00270 [Zophobihabitans entericus]